MVALPNADSYRARGILLHTTRVSCHVTPTSRKEQDPRLPQSGTLSQSSLVQKFLLRIVGGDLLILMLTHTDPSHRGFQGPVDGVRAVKVDTGD